MAPNLNQLILYNKRRRWGDLSFAEWKELILHEMLYMGTVDKEVFLELLEDIDEEEKYLDELVEVAGDHALIVWKSGKKKILMLRKGE